MLTLYIQMILDVPPKIVGGRTLIPTWAIAEAFGAKVEHIKKLSIF